MCVLEKKCFTMYYISFVNFFELFYTWRQRFKGTRKNVPIKSLILLTDYKIISSNLFIYFSDFR